MQHATNSSESPRIPKDPTFLWLWRILAKRQPPKAAETIACASS